METMCVKGETSLKGPCYDIERDLKSRVGRSERGPRFTQGRNELHHSRPRLTRYNESQTRHPI